MDENKTFHYRYSAKEQQEIEALRRKYAVDTQEESVLEELRKLDHSTTTPGLIAALTVGILGTLTLGGGLSMTILSPKLLMPGIILGLLGLVLALLALPVYTRITDRKRQQNARRIQELSDRLLPGQSDPTDN